VRQLKSFFKHHFFDVPSLEKIFYEVIRNKSPAEMSFEEFVEGLRMMSIKLVRVVMREEESVNAMLTNEDLLFNRLLL
jgi:hypothetical protein